MTNAKELRKIPHPDAKKTLLEVNNIEGIKVRVYWDQDDILLQSKDFAVIFPEKPNAEIAIIKNNLPYSLLSKDSELFNKLCIVGEQWRKKVYERIRKDWGEDCFIPDDNGCWHHPIFEDIASKFECFHCKGQFLGNDLAINFWHCPSSTCDGSPLNIHGLNV